MGRSGRAKAEGLYPRGGAERAVGGLGAVRSPRAPGAAEVEVYQMGWRAGGRAASARNPRRGTGSSRTGRTISSARTTTRSSWYGRSTPSSEAGATDRSAALEDEFTPRNLLVGKRQPPRRRPGKIGFSSCQATSPGRRRGGEYARPFDYCLMACKRFCECAWACSTWDDPRGPRGGSPGFPAQPVQAGHEVRRQQVAAILRSSSSSRRFIVNYPIAWICGAPGGRLPSATNASSARMPSFGSRRRRSMVQRRGGGLAGTNPEDVERDPRFRCPGLGGDAWVGRSSD